MTMSKSDSDITVYNKDKKTTLAHGVRWAHTHGDRARGLIGETEPRGLLLSTRFGIHTIGLKFPIDVAVMDFECYVRAVRRNLPPYSFFFWNPRYATVLELPGGTLARTGTALGDYLEIRSTV